jgi:surfactin synthase thioesterase subunit/aryl carrier-like protein
MAANEDFYRQNLERNGLTTIHSEHCLELLGLLMETGRVQTTVCPIDFETWLRFNPAGREGRLQGLLSEATLQTDTTRVRSNEEAALREALATLDQGARALLAQSTIQRLLAQVLRAEVEKIDVRRSLTALGADSLMAIEIKNRLEQVGLAISVTQLLNRSSVTTLASALLEALGCEVEEVTLRDEARLSDPPPSSWLVRRPRQSAKLRLICFPYAGGGPSVYHSWSEALPESIEVVSVNLPGRGARAEEGPLQSIAHAADSIVPELLPLLDRPFALFGHCMGAIIMYEVAERLQRLHAKSAAHLFASGCMAPHLYNSPIVHEQPDDRFLDVLRLISFSGTRALIEDPELRQTMFPLLRADFRAVAHYGDHLAERAPLNSPITGLAATNDLFAAPKAMEAWSGYTAGGYHLAQLEGDHYFVESDRDRVLQIVRARLAEAPTSLADISGVVWTRPENDALGRAPHDAGVRRGSTGRRSASRRARFGEPVRALCFPPAGVRGGEIALPNSGDQVVRYEMLDWRAFGGSEPTQSVGEMVSAAEAALGGDLSGPTIFYGHCIGAIVAYELALRLQREGRSAPDHLVVIGTVGPHLYVAPDAHRLPTPKLIELLQVLSYPFAARLKEDPSFLAERLGMVRADLAAMASYQYQSSERLKAPITAVSLRLDLWSYPLRTPSWQSHTDARCEVVEWPGDHYYTLRHPERIHEVIRSLSVTNEARARAAGLHLGDNHESSI